MKSRPTSSDDDGSGGEDHPGGDSTDDVFVYDGVGLVMAWTTKTAHPRTRKTGSGAKVNFALSTQSVPTGKARW